MLFESGLWSTHDTALWYERASENAFSSVEGRFQASLSCPLAERLVHARIWDAIHYYRWQTQIYHDNFACVLSSEADWHCHLL